MWSDHADFILGEKIYKLQINDDNGRVVATPSVAHILAYDDAVREDALRLVNSGVDIAQAYLQARIDDPPRTPAWIVFPRGWWPSSWKNPGAVVDYRCRPTTLTTSS